MRYCWARSDQEGTRLKAVSVSFCLIMIWGILVEIVQGNIPLTIFLALCFLPAFRFLFVCSRKYSVSGEGLTIRYLFGVTKFYSWDQFTDVGLARVHPSAGPNTSTLAIRCVIGGEKFGPRQASSAREDWARKFYEVRYYKKIISVYHTPDRLAEFQKYFPFPIIDYSSLT